MFEKHLKFQPPAGGPLEACEQFDRSYAGLPAYFGLRPSAWVVRWTREAHLAGKRALDLGSGPGRNAVYLARRNLEVTAVDSSAAALRELDERARRHGLPVHTVCADLRAMSFRPESYDYVLAVTVLGLFEPATLRELAGRMTAALRPGGLLLVEEFSRGDPGCVGLPGASEFAGLMQHYFACEEMPALFEPLEALACQQISLRDSSHGPEHRHSLVRYAAKKP